MFRGFSPETLHWRQAKLMVKQKFADSLIANREASRPNCRDAINGVSTIIYPLKRARLQ